LSDIRKKNYKWQAGHKVMPLANACPTLMDFGELKIHTRHLPHWESDGAIYFVTFRTKTTTLSIQEQSMVLQHIVEGNSAFYTLLAAIIMPDHVHILLLPLSSYSLSRIMKGIKGASARKINIARNTTGTIWQDESYDRIVRDEKELKIKILYMLNNPVKKELTDDPWHYHGWWYNNSVIA
jgi:REP element-mobilizing transposase RayT